MSSSAPLSLRCPECSASVPDSYRNCPACEADVGFPNVRLVDSPEEVTELSFRFRKARTAADNRELKTEFDEFLSELEIDSHVVIATTSSFARKLLSDPQTLYANYEKLVGSGVRTPGPFESESQRFAVGAILFGDYASEITYGALSLNGLGLSNYGLIFLRLKNKAIEKRVSFLEENSFHFIEKKKITPGSLFPCGFRSSWKNRAKLALAKIEPSLTGKVTKKERPAFLLVQGNDRTKDDFIEAHIFGRLNADSVEFIAFGEEGASREEKNNIKAITSLCRDKVLISGGGE